MLLLAYDQLKTPQNIILISRIAMDSGYYSKKPSKAGGTMAMLFGSSAFIHLL
jgi:hypothetical protein